MPGDFLDELRWRGLLHQCTNETALHAHLSQERRRIYAGFDPTADSLTIGNMVPIMLLIHAARAGHEPVVVMGGGTGLIGDPSGKSDERRLMTREQVERNVQAQRGIFARMFAHAGLDEPRILNNLDWLDGRTFLDVLRDIGKHFSVNQMIARESVRSRLEEREQGISYTEFSYMILQAMDFLHLFDEHGVTIQAGGSDQWGNIVAGADLIRRSVVESLVFGVTTPLVTKSDGGKFGKTEAGAVWLTSREELAVPDQTALDRQLDEIWGEDPPTRTGAYAMHQFWLNTPDEDVIRFLKLFTLLSQDQITDIERAHTADPAKREAQLALADEATHLVHGEAEQQQAKRAARALFSGDVSELPLDTLKAVLGETPSSDHPRVSLDAGVSLVDILVTTKLAPSRRRAREFLHNGSISINGQKADPDATLTPADLLHDRIIAIRRGKKHWHVTRWA